MKIIYHNRKGTGIYTRFLIVKNFLSQFHETLITYHDITYCLQDNNVPGSYIQILQYYVPSHMNDVLIKEQLKCNFYLKIVECWQIPYIVSVDIQTFYIQEYKL